MNFGFITTSRADFGYYIPLLKLINKSAEHKYFIFAGGMHLSEKFGTSVNLIEQENFKVHEKINSLHPNDNEEGISISMGQTLKMYAKIWKKYQNTLDLVFVLGDRFEMFSAAASIIPFNIPIAHLHGGETTLGAIDNKFRHAISCFSKYHFTSNIIHAKRVSAIIGSTNEVHNVGATALDSMQQMELYSANMFYEKFQFDITEPYILSTFHPETIAKGNREKVKSLLEVFKQIPEIVLCTLPNADTEGSIVRTELLNFEKKFPEKIRCFENLGQVGYYTAMKHCCFMLGNTSSGIIEACSYNTPVVNVGDRQKGRLCGPNVIHSSFEYKHLRSAVDKAQKLQNMTFNNPYGDGTTSKRILEILTLPKK